MDASRRPGGGWLTPQRLAVASLAVDCCMLLAKLAAGLVTGSLGLLSEAAHTGLDLVASGFAVVAIRAARKPADPEHPYGHGRAENLASLGEGVILLIAAAGIAFEGVRRLLGEPVEVDPALYAIGLMAGTMLLEAVRATALLRTARAWGSPALAAGAQNRLADIVSSAGVLAGLVGVRLGFQWADIAAALLVAVLVARAAAMLVYRSADILIDRAPSGVEDAVRQTIAAVPGVRRVGAVRVRRSGGRMLGDARVSARPTLSVEGAQRLSQDVLAAVAGAHPDLDIAVVVEPQSDEHNLVERVHAVAAGLEMIRDLHNVTVERERDGSLHISMHAKLPGKMTLEEAAAATAELERLLREEFPGVMRVDVHLEPLEPEVVAGADVTEVRPDLAREIWRIVEAHPEVRACRDVELSERAEELIAHVVAELPGAVTLEHAHAVETALEERLRRQLPELSEVVARVAP
ncbi:MAG TPA: cation diffusion facilitator family transporter [Candidatus Dormibacteraeota bacterium]